MSRRRHSMSRNTGLLIAIVSVVTLPSCHRASLADGHWFETAQYSGVAVAVTWDLVGGPTGAHASWLMLAETVTDEKGEYEFPAWGPVRRPRNTALLADQPWL